MKISNNISYNEAVKSSSAVRFGIDNTPNEQQLSNMKLLAEKVFQPLREWHGKPIGISSFFRCKELNKLIGGSKNSQHVALNGAAMDIDADIYENGINNLDIFNYIKDNLDFDQLIMEGLNPDGTPQWIHVSYVSTEKNRKQVLICEFIKGKAIYKTYNNE
jgi:hypothetical protein